MTQVIIVVRKAGSEELNYSLPFELSEIPRAGDYISIFREDSSTHSEDLIVRHVWWHLFSPAPYPDGRPKIGHYNDIMVECDIAIGPYARDSWRESAEAHKRRGADIPTFNVSRIAVVPDKTKPEKGSEEQ